MHGDSVPEIVDIKDKGWAGKVSYKSEDGATLRIIGQMKNEYYIAKEEVEGGKVKAYNLKVVRLL